MEKVNAQAELQACTGATKASKDNQDIKMIDDATTGEDSTVDVHLLPHSHGKAKYPSQIKISSKYGTAITLDSTVEFSYGHEMAYFDARSKGLVQINNSKHFPPDQYLHDRVTPMTLSPKLLAYDKPIDPTETPRISTLY